MLDTTCFLPQRKRARVTLNPRSRTVTLRRTSFSEVMSVFCGLGRGRPRRGSLSTQAFSEGLLF
jgi:hypothetical protein